MGRFFVCVVVVLTLGCVSPSTAADVGTGVAYDSVSKGVDSETPALRSADFEADFRSGQHPGSMCTPSLTRRYITIQKERIDEVCQHESIIVDCKARTATLIALEAKTYYSVSLDTKYDDFRNEVSASMAKVAMTSTIDIQRTMLGSQSIDGRLTDDYKMVGKLSVASDLMSLTTVDSWTYYFLPTRLPELACIDVANPWLSRYGGASSYRPGPTSFEGGPMEALRVPGMRVTESGPELPPWRIPLYAVGSHFQHQSGEGGITVDFDFTYFVEVESGNVRPIPNDDLVFEIPTGFSKMQMPGR